MSLAYVLLKCDEGSEKQLLRKIKSIDEVKEAQETYGPFGAVVKIEYNDTRKVKKILNEKICCLNGINSSMTLVAPEDSNNDPKPEWDEIRGLTWMFYESELF